MEHPRFYPVSPLPVGVDEVFHARCPGFCVRGRDCHHEAVGTSAADHFVCHGNLCPSVELQLRQDAPDEVSAVVGVRHVGAAFDGDLSARDDLGRAERLEKQEVHESVREFGTGTHLAPPGASCGLRPETIL